MEGEVDGGAGADGAFGPGPAAVAVDDALDAGQAGAGAGAGGGAEAGVLAGRVEPLEGLEQLVGVGGIEAGPVVAYVAAEGGVIDGSGGELDGGVLAASGELPRVLEQVRQHDPDQGRIDGDPDAVLDGHPDPAAGVTRGQLVADGGDLGAEVEVLEVHLGG